ncbi:hypothetical protein SAMN05518849_12824 [Sphingobium sp. AP50]|uniref:hypothetical protein n=1 Tax=Sphingobium sp. AP50 TaxID=1884369 RepID=UPI0008BB7A5C|nr:hypothetical protein [Sphingobium sp. AP50]SEK02128.1 hypothetical protein SAMN05518849_12824 [Sphingobium sp. AP50]
MDVMIGRSLVINMPNAFKNADFKAWLWTATPKFFWGSCERIDEWSDVVVLVDPSLNGEGSDSDMPQAIWMQIVETCRACLGADHSGTQPHYMVRLTNLAV